MNFHFIVPNNLNQISGGSIYDRMLVQQLENRDHRITIHEIVGIFPHGRGLEQQSREIIGEMGKMSHTSVVVIDGITIMGFNPADLRMLVEKGHILIVISHLPINLQEHPVYNGYSPDRFEKERAIYHLVSYVIVPSKETHHMLVNHYSVPPEKIGIIPPGTLPAHSDGRFSSNSAFLELLCVGNFVPNKGYLELLEGLSHTNHQEWRLRCIGRKEDDPEYYSRLSELRDQHRAAARIEFLDAVPYETLGKYYNESDVYITTSQFETYGMARADAFAFGLPVVTTDTGHLPTVQQPYILVDASDPKSIAAAVDELSHSAQREELAIEAKHYARNLPSWSDACNNFLKVIRSCTSPARKLDFQRWLELRYPHDVRARNSHVQQVVIDRIESTSPEEIVILDMGSGLGANSEYLADLFERDQVHLLVDTDGDLITSSPPYLELKLEKKGWRKQKQVPPNRLEAYRSSIREIVQRRDASLVFAKYQNNKEDRLQYLSIIHEQTSLLSLPEHVLELDLDLITANAVFDLFSQDQFRDFLDQLPSVPLYLTLNYTGTEIMGQENTSQTEFYLDLYDKHMQRTQSFGQAMGKDGPQLMRKVLVGRGYRTREGASHWQLGELDKEMMLFLLHFMEEAVPEVLEKADPGEFDEWIEDIRKLILNGSLRMVVEHQDIVALPSSSEPKQKRSDERENNKT